MSEQFVLAPAPSSALTLSSGASGTFELTDLAGGLMMIAAVAGTFEISQPVAQLVVTTTGLQGDPGPQGIPGPPGPGDITSAFNDNVGGIGVFKNEAAGILHFYGINAASSKVTVTLDVVNDKIDINVVEANLTLDNIGGTLSNAKLATMAAFTIKGNNTGAPAAPINLTVAETKTLLAIAEADVANLVADLALKAPLASPALTGNPTAPTQAALNNSTRLATTAYVDAATTAIIAAADVMVFKGVIDCSASPNYPAADRGWTYRVSVAGKIGGGAGLNVEIGDLLLCLTDGTAAGNQATVGAQWSIAQTNIDGAVVGPASAVDSTPAVFDGATGKLIKNITFASFKTSLAIVSTDLADFTEASQDVIGGLLITAGDLTWTYNDGANTLSAAITANAVTFAKMQDIATARFMGRITAASGDPELLTGTQATTLLDVFTSLLQGVVPASGGGSVNFLRADSTWAAPPGGGGGGITLATEQATTAGTVIDFTGIPATAKRITIIFAGVSMSGTSNWLVQLGDSGGIEITGYLSGASLSASSLTSTAGFILFGQVPAAANAHNGRVVLNLENAASNRWVADGQIQRPDGFVNTSAGLKSLSAVLDRVRITAANGTDTFDAGAINISYE